MYVYYMLFLTGKITVVHCAILNFYYIPLVGADDRKGNGKSTE